MKAQAVTIDGIEIEPSSLTISENRTCQHIVSVYGLPLETAHAVGILYSYVEILKSQVADLQAELHKTKNP